jgi:3-phenylpropionate/cinnamic acid dioxygenase small subunit
MTLDELLAREAIRKTMAAYTMAGDRLREEEFVAVFTEDAILETEGVPENDAFRYEGREAIRGWISRWRKPAGEAPVHQASFIRHHLSTCHIEFSGAEAARTRTYWVAYTDLGPDHGGYYVDDFRKVGDAWLIAHRRIRMDWRRGDSLHMDSVAKTRG